MEIEKVVILAIALIYCQNNALYIWYPNNVILFWL